MKLTTRHTVVSRAKQRCELCYSNLSPMSLHHRRPRGMGGSSVPWIHDPENLLALCGTGTTGCHGLVESYRQRAYDFGWLVRYGMTPHNIPFADLHGHWWLLHGELKLEIAIPFDSPNPSSIPPPPGVGLDVKTPREENNDRPY